jgi:hypothetical protein
MTALTSAHAASADSPPTVSLPYLYLLRFGYLLLVVGLGSSIWPAVIQRVPWALSLAPWNSVADSLLAGLSLLSILGLRYPLKMIPLLLFELTWKSIWLLAVALPLWMSHTPIDANMGQTIQACLMAVIFPFLIPWRYVFATFARGSGDRWR